jgi:3-phenylpropionate/cinnamic acid dioxygenase small subunit
MKNQGCRLLKFRAICRLDLPHHVIAMEDHSMESASRLSAEVRFAIEDLLYRFMRSFDDKDWATMRGCLADVIDCDYSSFRATPPSQITRDEYVSLRQAALASLKTQHDLSNIAMLMFGSQVEVRCNYAILRYARDFDGSPQTYFHSYGQYRFTMSGSPTGWRIASIAQTLLTNEGNPALHPGAQR